MARFIQCACCGEAVPVTDADLGRMVMCPRNGTPTLVGADNVREVADAAVAPARRSGGGTFAAALVLVLLLAGLIGWEFFPREPAAEPEGRPVVAQAGATPAPSDAVEIVPLRGPEPAPPAAEAVEPAAPVASVASSKPELGGSSPAETPKWLRRGPAAVAPPAVVVRDTPSAGEARPAPAAEERPEPAGEARLAPAAEAMPVPQPVPAPEPALPAATPAVPSLPVPLPEPDGVGRRLRFAPLAKRIDTRDEEALRQELRAKEEVRLDTQKMPQTTLGLVQLAGTLSARGVPYSGPAMLAKVRPDLAGLDYRLGQASLLSKEQASAMKAFSARVRRTVEGCIAAGSGDPRPDPAMLEAAFLAAGSDWTDPAVLPCFQQMLQPQTRAVRRTAAEAVSRIDAKAATETLAHWAVFDISAEVRGAAVAALQARPRAEYVPVLLEAMRYPWARAAEHAAEALVALECKEAVPDLATLLGQPDPDRPYKSGRGGRQFVRQVIRVNHLANCVMCHSPSFDANDPTLIRGAVPDRSKPLPPPSTVPAYYTSGEHFVQANQTFVKQDFSVEQPESAPGNWPQYQRYDYLVKRRPATADEAKSPEPTASAYRAAALFALRELTGRSAESPEAFADLGRKDELRFARIDAADAQFESLLFSPDATLRAAYAGIGITFLSMSEIERERLLLTLSRQLGREETLALFRLQFKLLVTEGGQRGTEALESLAWLSLWEKRVPKASDARSADAGPPASDSWPADVKAAVALLRDASPDRRVEGAQALGRLGNRAAVASGVLRAALSDPDARVRLATARALKSLPEVVAEIVMAIARALGDTDADVARAVSEVLREFRGATNVVVNPAIDALADGRARWSAAVAAEIAANLARMIVAANLDARPLAERLERLMQDAPTPAEKRRWFALIAATRYVTPTMAFVASEMLAEPSSRRDAQQFLQLAKGQAVEPVTRMLDHSDAPTRQAAAEVLGRIGRPAYDAKPKLLALERNDPNPGVQRAAADAVKALGTLR